MSRRSRKAQQNKRAVIKAETVVVSPFTGGPMTMDAALAALDVSQREGDVREHAVWEDAITAAILTHKDKGENHAS